MSEMNFDGFFDALADKRKRETRVRYTERELIQRAINQATITHKRNVVLGKRAPTPRWAIVKNLFACGSTQAVAICRKYGYDPDKMVGE